MASLTLHAQKEQSYIAGDVLVYVVIVVLIKQNHNNAENS